MGNTEEFTSVEWFAGGAGNHQGLSRVIPNLRCVAFCEREGYAVSNLVAAMEEGRLAPAPIWTDCRTFPVEPFIGRRLDLFIASYPCQGESVAGNQLGTEDPRFLWPYCRGFVAAVRPLFCFFENVRGHVNTSMVEVLRDLAELQYAVEPGIFSAEECGGAHSRERVFILARDLLADASDGLLSFPGWGQEERNGVRSASSGFVVDATDDNGGSGECGEETGVGSSGIGGRGSAGSGADLAYSDDLGQQQPCGDQREGGGWTGDGVEALAYPLDRGSQAGRSKCLESVRNRRDENFGPASEEPGVNVEHPSGLGRGEGRPESEFWSGRGAVAEPSGEVADSAAAGLRSGGGAECGASHAGAGKRYLADAFCQGSQRSPSQSSDRGGVQREIGRGGDSFSQSPPGPGDGDGWSRVLRFAPFLAPSLRRSEAERIFHRVADGVADESYLHELRSLFCENRVDRLRMLGNGVYPYSAAVAWLVLLAKMRENFNRGSL